MSIAGKRHSSHPADVALEDCMRPSTGRLPEADYPILAAAGQQAPIGRKGQVPNPARLVKQGRKGLAGTNIPKLYCVIKATTNQQVALCGERYPPDSTCMAPQDSQHSPSIHIP